MIRHRLSFALVWMGLSIAGLSLATAAARDAQAQSPHGGPAGAGDHAHSHVPVPPSHANAHIPTRVWTDARMIARGQEIWAARCAACHGDTGDGRGPAGASLPLKPADLTDARMIAEMPGNYWFWRVSEGGLVEPYRSRGSVMPAWKGELSVADRWAVIVYAHTLSGHAGPHVSSEHPGMGGSHGSH